MQNTQLTNSGANPLINLDLLLDLQRTIVFPLSLNLQLGKR